MKRILIVAFVVMGFAGGAAAEEMTCGQHIAAMAAMPAKMSEVMTSGATMMEAHAALMLQDKTKPSKAEAAAMKKMAGQYKKLAAEFKKLEDMMTKASSWPAAPHDMNKMMADEAQMKAMQDVLAKNKEMNALLTKNIADMEAMMKGGAHAGHK